jgi:hypothetical protein
MKTSTIVLCALALSTAFTAVKVSAVSTSPSFAVLSVSGTADFFKTNYIKFDHKGTNIVDTNYITTTITRSFNSKYVYNLISNAVANAGLYDTNLVSTILPANGYIAFDPLDTDGNIYGFFYATNKTGFYYPLSGAYLTTNGIPIPVTITNYYSFIELDTDVPLHTFGLLGYIGFNGNGFNDVYNVSYDAKTLDGTYSSTSSALLYIHDNPLSFDVPANLYTSQTNTAAIEIWGVLKLGLTYKDGNLSHASGSLKGSGNIMATPTNDFSQGVITSGTATLSF